MRTVEHDPSKGLNAAVAATLNAERVAAGLTFEGLADLVGTISARTLMRQLSTVERHIDVADLSDLARVFRLSSSDVIRMAEERMGRKPTTRRSRNVS